MLRWLLRIFPSLRDMQDERLTLREANKELLAQNTRLEDRLEAAIEERGKLWRMVEIAQAGEREAYRMQINHAVQRAGGGVPFPEAHSLPPNSIPDPNKSHTPIARAMLPGEAVRSQTSKFLQDYVTDIQKGLNE